LTPSEAECLNDLASARDERMPDHVRGNFPRWLEDELQRRFGADLAVEMAAFGERAPVDVRVNLLRATRDKARAALAEAGVASEPCRHSPVGLRLAGRASLGGLEPYRKGKVEVQDEGSQMVCLLADARPGMQVLDLCAGGGGKTLGLAAAMGGKGQVYACDVNRARLERLRPRLKRAGAHNVQLRRLASEDDPWLGTLAGGIDRVLVDAPCSGSGTWRRSPDLKWRLTPESLDRYVEMQGKLLRAAAPLVKEGGRLIYATCSILPRENEDQVRAFLAERPDFQVLSVCDIWPDAVGGTCPVEGPFLSLTPLREQTDGFFAAVFQRGTAGADTGS
jgi:16S rRNA (cytosine967-C5)-methyltransferase